MTQRDEDKRVLRGKVAAKGATVIFWRLRGGAEDALLVLRVLLVDFVAIFGVQVDRRTLSLAPEFWKWTTMVDESTLDLTVILHGTTQTRCIVVPKATGNALVTLNNISWQLFRSFTIVSFQSCPESTTRFNQPIQRENKT